MDYAIPEMETITEQLKSLERPKKPKMLVVDDEPDNLDLLYRTFRREFQVLKAESGVQALDVLSAEGEVAVIISDQRMPEMKGTEFLSRTVPKFPDTMRIILTGFTDVEDLVDAINSGQVYRYITKPWDPSELKEVVQRAAETYELLKQRTEELRRSQAQTALLAVILQTAQKAAKVADCLAPIAQAFGENFQADVCIVQQMDAGAMTDQAGLYSATGSADNWLQNDPMAKAAIASQNVQVAVNIPADKELADVAHYSASGIQSHLILPLIFRGTMVAVLSLQWKQPQRLSQDQILTLHLCAQQAALAIISPRAQA